MNDPRFGTQYMPEIEAHGLTPREAVAWAVRRVEEAEKRNGGPLQSMCREFNALAYLTAEARWMSTPGRPAFKLWPELVEGLAKTKLTVRWGDIQWPFDTLELRFPNSHPLMVHGIACGAALLFRAETEDAHTGDRRGMCWMAGEPVVPINDRRYSTHPQGCIMHAKDYETIEDLLAGPGNDLDDEYDEGVYPMGSLQPDESVAGRVAFRIVLGSLLCITGGEPDMVERDVLAKDRHRFAEASPADRERMASKAEKRTGRKVCTVGRTIRLPRKHYDSKDSQPSGRHVTYSFIRCGHWRRQRHGEGRKLVRPVWIRPTRVRPDLPEQEGQRTYQVEE